MLICLLVFLPILCGPAAYAAGERTVRIRSLAAGRPAPGGGTMPQGAQQGAHSLGGEYGSGAVLLRDLIAAACSAAVLALSLIAAVLRPSFTVGGVFADGLHFTVSGFQGTYAAVTAVMWLFTSLFAFEYFKEEPEHLSRYWMFILVTLGATEGVMLSADLMTSFVFFELLSFTSFTWVIHEETPEAVRAGKTYLAVAVIGGLVLFLGLLLMKHAAGTLNYAALREMSAGGRHALAAGAASAAEAGSLAAAGGDGAQAAFPGSRGEVLAAGICILLGFGAKAGMFPLHIWLPRAHPVAPSPASALLSGVLTKVGIYGILMTTLSVFAGNLRFGLIVLAAGLVTMVLGAVLALFSVNLKRTLACSSMSQIGFILTGTAMVSLSFGEESAELALAGTVLHMVNHSMIKLTLFMAAGVVVMNAHTLTLNDIRGFGRRKNALKLAFALGALGISGVPLFGGYISKTLLHEGIAEGIEGASGIYGALPALLPGLLRGAEWVFLFSGGITFAYMLKLFLCIFVERNADPERQRRYDGYARTEHASAGADAHSVPAEDTALSAPLKAAGTYMNRLSAAVIVGSSFAMVILGQPAVMLRLAAFMTGDGALAHHFRAFAPGNLKGGFISLSIGAVLYLTVVRHVLYRPDRGYVDLWPAGLDLENAFYRPLLLRWLPGVFGRLAKVFGENRLTKPLASRILALSGRAAQLFGENRVLGPLCHAAVLTTAFVSRVLADGTDAFVWLMRKTAFRERKVITASEREGRAEIFLEETEHSMQRFGENFTFVLMMTCIGILVILGTMIWMMR